MSKIMKSHGFIFVCVLVLTFSACRNTQVPSSSSPGENEASILQSLPDLEYPIEMASTGKAQLQYGKFEEAAAPGSATMTKISLGKEQVPGDLDGDGDLDAAVTLVADPGGSGTFTYLAAVRNQNGTAQPIGSIFLGDRIRGLSVLAGEGRGTTRDGLCPPVCGRGFLLPLIEYTGLDFGVLFQSARTGGRRRLSPRAAHTGLVWIWQPASPSAAVNAP